MNGEEKATLEAGLVEGRSGAPPEVQKHSLGLDRLATVHFCRLCSTCPPPLHTDVNLLAGLLEQGWGTDEHFTAIFLSASSEL